MKSRLKNEKLINRKAFSPLVVFKLVFIFIIKILSNIDNYNCQLIKLSKVLKTSIYKEGSPGFGFTDNV